MENTWKLQDAKAKFSQVVDEAIKKGPQMVTKRGDPAVIILSNNDYKRLNRKKNFKAFLLDSPKLDTKFEFERQKDKLRSIKL